MTLEEYRIELDKIKKEDEALDHQRYLLGKRESELRKKFAESFDGFKYKLNQKYLYKKKEVDGGITVEKSAIVTVANIKYGDKYVSLILATETNQHIFLTYNYNGELIYDDDGITLEEI